MKKIIAKLVKQTNEQRFYELSEPIYKGRRFGKDIDIAIEVKESKEHIKPEYRDTVRDDGCHIICISDAHTHIERLVFVAEKFSFGYGRLGVQIDGCHTMMIHGGDSRYVYPDEVYLRHLGIINGVKIEMINV